jgi:hypothetical protein
VIKQHFDFLPPVSGPLIIWCFANGTCHVAAVLVEVARYLAGGRVWAADRLRRANGTVFRGGAVAAASILIDAGPRRRISPMVLDEGLAFRADVAVIFAIPGEVPAGLSTICPLRSIKDWDVRRDLLLLYQPS